MITPPLNNDHQHVKKERVDSPYSLKTNKDSHLIKKPKSSLLSSSPPSSSSSSASPLNNAAAANGVSQQRHPVIIYTHSPKVITTHPKDFMALVQKLTGLSPSNHQNHHHLPPPTQLHSNIDGCGGRNDFRKSIVSQGTPSSNDDNECTSVVTDENNGVSGGTNVGEAQVNSCFVPPPMFDPAPSPCFNSYPFLNPNPNAVEFVCSDRYHSQPFYNYSADSSFLYMPNIRSSSPLDNMKELPEF